ncbi:hypothetical protein BJF78_07735 [Pseudonocardia sp. CNS-139]|nr:hypothetical protein BJF78_07735 [Pseudonocardia sp. CNS-139]
MTRDELRVLDALLVGNGYPDDVLDALLPHVAQYRELAAALRALPLGEVPNALVLPAGGRK